MTLKLQRKATKNTVLTVDMNEHMQTSGLLETTLWRVLLLN